jgi:hypothetical protein
MLRSSHNHRPARSLLLPALVAALVASALASSVVSARSGPSVAAKASTKPTVVLVHGAFADASGWTGVITRLQHRGYQVIAPPNPLRGVTGDVAYIKSVLATREGVDRARRPLLRRLRDHQRRVRQSERQGAGLHRRVRPQGRATPSGPSTPSRQAPRSDPRRSSSNRSLVLTEPISRRHTSTPTRSGRCSRPTCPPRKRL